MVRSYYMKKKRFPFRCRNGIPDDRDLSLPCWCLVVIGISRPWDFGRVIYLPARNIWKEYCRFFIWDWCLYPLVITFVTILSISSAFAKAIPGGEEWSFLERLHLKEKKKGSSGCKKLEDFHGYTIQIRGGYIWQLRSIILRWSLRVIGITLTQRMARLVVTWFVYQSFRTSKRNQYLGRYFSPSRGILGVCGYASPLQEEPGIATFIFYSYIQACVWYAATRVW